MPRQLRTLTSSSWLCAALLLFLVGCSTPERPTITELQATLPTEVAGERLDFVQVVEEQISAGGHPIDDALRRLEKTRANASAVFLDSSRGLGGVGAAAVDGVTGQQLLEAVFETWMAPAIISRTQHVDRGRSVWLLQTRNGHWTYIYARGEIVYFAQSSDAAFARACLEALP